MTDVFGIVDLLSRIETTISHNPTTNYEFLLNPFLQSDGGNIFGHTAS